MHSISFRASISLAGSLHEPMTYQFKATCQCGYRSDILMGLTAACQNCRQLVDASRAKFRYTLRPCPKCGAPIREEDLLGEGWLVFDQPSSITCPSCGDRKLTFNSICHMHLKHGTDFPNIGDEIDGCIDKRGRIEIPWFKLEAPHVVHDVPAALAPGQRVRLRVKEIKTGKPTNAVLSMFYDRVVTELKLEYLCQLESGT